ncbi:MAG: class I SAM-dependent DNA methyltransferase, partial [Coriobacteriia bacterium]|nr:class I SAM-dependent DNA methyltransferase [Coriobacteriia bacterium]
ESILSGDERRAGGMHYTSVDNIHKVIDPLFLDDLRSELNAAGNRSPALSALQEKIAGLKFLDPACGSGNFLTQTYLELRALENDILKRLVGDNMAFDFGFGGGGG